MNNKKIPELVSIFTNLDELIQGSQKSGEQFFIRYPNTKAGDNIHMMFSAYHGTAFIAAMVDDANWKTKFEPNILGNHSAAFCTNEATGLYLYETSDP